MIEVYSVRREIQRSLPVNSEKIRNNSGMSKVEFAVAEFHCIVDIQIFSITELHKKQHEMTFCSPTSTLLSV